MKPTDDDPRVLAASTLCRIEDIGGGRVDVQLGHVVFRLSRSELASLAGTLQRVVRQLLPRRRVVVADLQHLRVVRDGGDDNP